MRGRTVRRTDRRAGPAGRVAGELGEDLLEALARCEDGESTLAIAALDWARREHRIHAAPAEMPGANPGLP